MPAPVRSKTPKLRLIALSCAVPLLLCTATGCGQQTGNPAHASNEEAVDQEETKRPTRGALKTQEATARAEALLEAGQTAHSVVKDAEVVALDHAEEGWTVRLAASDGVEHEVRMQENGTTLIGLPLLNKTPKGKRDQNRLRLHLSKVDHRKALKSFQENGPEGQVRSLALKNHDDRVVWTITLDEGIRFHVDALTAHLSDD